jgi:hypothetical protein
MTEMDSDILPEAARLADRIRALQADMVQEPLQARQEFISNEIKRSMAVIAPTQRPEFCSALAEQFPRWDGNDITRQQTNASGQSQTGVNSNAMDQQDPSFLVQQLCKLAPKLPQALKETLLERLADAGLVPRSAPDWPGEVLSKFRSRLQLDDGVHLHAGHVLELTHILSDLAMSIDQIAWNMWKIVAPGSKLHRGAPLQRLMSRFVANDLEVSREQVSNEFEKLRKLNAALLSSVGETGRQFSSRYGKKFAPAEIEAAVRTEHKKFMANIKNLCWDKYCELAAENLDEADVDHEIREIVREFVDKVI